MKKKNGDNFGGASRLPGTQWLPARQRYIPGSGKSGSSEAETAVPGQEKPESKDEERQREKERVQRELGREVGREGWREREMAAAAW